MKSYKQKNYEQALIETYLKFDELLRLEKVNQFLKNNMMSKKDSRLDITFSSGLQADYGSSPVNFGEVMRTEEVKIQKMEKILDSGSRENNLISVQHIPKENIIDLTKKENLPNLNSNSPMVSSNGSRRESEGNNNSNKTPSKEVLTFDNRKIEISLKNNKDACQSGQYEELIAKDMGTTANILLIKNNYLYLANVGDSMSVIFKNGVATRLNQEHKTTLPSEFTRINKSGARIIHNRIEGRLNLTRAIGKKILFNYM
jgi:hypothetical protein